MAGRIFYRERNQYVGGSETPRYILLAEHNANLKTFGKHMRMCELKAIAEATGAELVRLPDGEQGEVPHALEVMLIEAADKAQLLLSACGAVAEELLFVLTKGERDQFIALLAEFVES
jgi:hypothetical protein